MSTLIETKEKLLTMIGDHSPEHAAVLTQAYLNLTQAESNEFYINRERENPGKLNGASQQQPD